jgi:transcriptional regulator with XRE-family HTH domain
MLQCSRTCLMIAMIRLIIKQSGFSQRSVAESLHMHTRTLSRYLTYRDYFPLNLISEILGICKLESHDPHAVPDYYQFFSMMSKLETLLKGTVNVLPHSHEERDVINMRQITAAIKPFYDRL